MTSRFLLALVILACTCSYLTLCNGDQAEFDVSSTGKAQEYCLTEPFRAKCLRNEVIVMTSALYGRMRVGRCLQDVSDGMLARMGNDPRFLGCSVDVLQIFDRRCSGKNQCEAVLTFDPDLQREKRCHAGLTNYLEGSYQCLTVVEADRSCHVPVSSNPLHIMRSSFSSPVTAPLNCGTKTQPWVLEAPAGQQINVSLLDFGLQQRATTGAEDRAGTNQQHCSQHYGYIVDKAAGTSANNVSICGLAEERSSNIYQSSANVIELIFKDSAIHDSGKP